jgi:hypothetical protein
VAAAQAAAAGIGCCRIIASSTVGTLVHKSAGIGIRRQEQYQRHATAQTGPAL